MTGTPSQRTYGEPVEPARSRGPLAVSGPTLAERQAAAVAAFGRALAEAEAAAAATAGSREARMDLDRHLDVLRATHEAILERRAQPAAEEGPTPSSPCRAVVAHRNAWFVDKVCTELTGRGVLLLDHDENGARALGVAIAEQPDLVLVEDRLLMLPGEEVVREVRRYVPDCLVAAQVAYSDDVPRMVDAGATTAYPRRVPPLDVAADLVRRLGEQLQPA